MPMYEVFLNCPEHKRLVSLVVSASDQEAAKYKVLNRTLACPYHPTHNFVVGFREGVKEILAVRAYPWKPPTTYVDGKIMGPISAAPQTVIPEEAKYVPPPPTEQIYYIDPKRRVEQTKRKEWWKVTIRTIKGEEQKTLEEM